MSPGAVVTILVWGVFTLCVVGLLAWGVIEDRREMRWRRRCYREIRGLPEREPDRTARTSR